MKNVNISNIVKSALFTTAIALATVNTQAATAPFRGKDEPVAIKYLGAVGNKPIFQVEFDNAAEEELIISLKDADGTVLYTEKFDDKKFSKRFQLERTEENLQVTLSITSKKDRQSQNFQISRNTRVVEDVTVTKVR